MHRIIPDVKNYPIDRSWTGVMPFSPDGHYVIGRIKCLPGEVYINTGMGSCGLMSGIGAGKIIA